LLKKSFFNTCRCPNAWYGWLRVCWEIKESSRYCLYSTILSLQ
jgi:hypothetical protein